MNDTKTLDQVKISEKVKIETINTEDTIKRRLLDMGMIEGTTIECVLQSPLKDPIAYFVRGTLIALRKDDSKNIIVKNI